MLRNPAPVLLASLLLVLSLPAPTRAGEDAAAKARAAKVIAALPDPTPAISIAYEGDLIIDGLWAGELDLAARIAKLGSQWVWRVTETSFLDWQGGEVREVVMLHLGRDLAILSGTYERSAGGETVSLGFSRSEAGFDVVRRTKQGETWGEAEKLTMKAPPGAAGTGGAALLFLRALKPAKGVTYALPWVPNPSWKSPEAATNEEPLRLTLAGEGTYERAKQHFDTSRVELANGETSWLLNLSRDHRKLISMVSKNGPVEIVPRGLGGERITADPAQAATTWKRAFLKFGFGYHMARKPLLEEAFHWDAMYEHETKVLGRWPADRPLEEFKQAWIDEFVANSKHRDVEGTRRLLAMTLATGTVTKETDDEVVFRAHPNFGGGTQRTYYLRKQDGVWGIVRIESAE